MTDIRFDRLTDLPLREAWRHEALDFTPWLAQNIDHLSDAIGMPLELTGTEVAVESFSADILARNPMDDSVVLIENQLDTTDHAHLGQIMTYLAGLEAQSVIWIAPQFREPHLSVIRWLNQHTADRFSFFAVKARVVRIGDSPFAPIFEVVEKPNDWERRIREKERSAKQTYPKPDKRHAFWSALAQAHPDLERHGPIAHRSGHALVRLWDDPEISLWLCLGAVTCGSVFRGVRSANPQLLDAARADKIIATIGAEHWSSDFDRQFATNNYSKCYRDQTNWPAMIDWMAREHDVYRAAVEQVMRHEPPYRKQEDGPCQMKS